MSLLVPNDGEEYILKLAFAGGTQEDFKLCLYTAVAGGAIDETKTTASFTEVVGNGYAEQDLTRAACVVTNAGGGSGEGKAAWPQATFNFSGGPVAVKGYFVKGAVSGKLYFAEAFAADANIPAGGGAIKITPQILLD